MNKNRRRDRIKKKPLIKIHAHCTHLYIVEIKQTNNFFKLNIRFRGIV